MNIEQFNFLHTNWKHTVSTANHVTVLHRGILDRIPTPPLKSCDLIPFLSFYHHFIIKKYMFLVAVVQMENKQQ